LGGKVFTRKLLQAGAHFLEKTKKSVKIKISVR